jgi:alkylresorcinol/alkylpyrone synthase
MFLTGLGIAVPPQRYTQSECWAAVQQSPLLPELDTRARALLKKVLTSENGIATRHFAVSNLTQCFFLTPDVLHSRFAHNAPVLAAQAAERAMDSAKISRDKVGALLISTCTGYLCPGLTSYVGERLGLRTNVLNLDLVGQGCGAAMPNFRTAEALLTAGKAQNVLSVCVEVCSAAFYLDNDPGVLISACLFGDGAGAAILSVKPAEHARRIEWHAASSFLSPTDRDELRFEQRDGMLRNILSPQVPAIAGKHVKALLHEMLLHSGLSQKDITGWILHGGGREVLMALQKSLGIDAEEVRLSAGILHDYGNVSSPFVLFVLEQALAKQAPGGWWWMATFGAGFSCHGALLKVD